VPLLTYAMSDSSDRAYWWLDAKAKGLSKWIDSNLGRIVIIAAFTWLAVWGFMLEEQDNLDTLRRLVRSLGPSLAGIVIAAVTIEALAERRQEQERKAQLIRQLGSKYRDVTEMALIELNHKGWLEDGALIRANLKRADLSGAHLTKANLRGADLQEVDLSGSDLEEANLSRANLVGVNLSGANLQRADLREAGLVWANLSRARLGSANLSGAYLQVADLSEANLVDADLSGADLQAADLSKAHLGNTNLSRANLRGSKLGESVLWCTNLSGVTDWSIEQLDQAKTLEGAIMPDGIQLGFKLPEGVVRIGQMVTVAGPNFKQWKAQYLAKYGGVENGIRAANEADKEPDEMANEQAKGSPPEPS